MTDKQLFELALDALEWSKPHEDSVITHNEAITALKERLAQPEQEPVAWISPSGALYRTRYHAVANAEQSLTPLYLHPPQRTAQNFCSRCGKRTPDLITIHTCTPPKENA